jgi:hypothetical protein
MDLAAKLAALRAQKAAEAQEALVKKEQQLEESAQRAVNKAADAVTVLAAQPKPETIAAVKAVEVETVAFKEAPPVISFTNQEVTDIDHLDFLSKMQSLQEAIHYKHPTMPVLLMQIHKQLRADPEIVTLLTEEAIGVIVKGLQVQTKTELVAVVVKESKAKAKKTPLSADMF